jgi:hypothetical protein
MSVVVVTPVDLALNTASADLPDASGTAITTGADGFSILVGASLDWPGRKVLFKFTDDGSGDTVTINAGDYPPALTQGLGNLAITLAASDVKYIVLEAARFMQSDGNVTGTSSGTGVLVEAFVLPREA